MGEEWIKEDIFLKNEGYKPQEIKQWNGNSLLKSLKVDFEIVKFTTKQINKLLSNQPITSEDNNGKIITENFDVIKDKDEIKEYDPRNDADIQTASVIDDDDDDDDDDYNDDDYNDY